MIYLLSPAKSLNFEPISNTIETSEPRFIDDSAYLMNKLKKLSPRQLAKLMTLNKELAELNFERNQKWSADNTDHFGKPSMYAFNGEVYRGLNAHEFDQKEIEYANKHLVILSGLYGLLKPLDRINAYRLEMGSRLKITPKQNNLYTYWGTKISEALNDELKNHDTKLIINLASNEYAKVIAKSALNYTMINCHFLDWKNDAYKSVMTWAKKARGLMANQVVKKKVDTLADLKKQHVSGYSYNEKLSTDQDLVFARKIS